MNQRSHFWTEIFQRAVTAFALLLCVGGFIATARQTASGGDVLPLFLASAFGLAGCAALLLGQAMASNAMSFLIRKQWGSLIFVAAPCFLGGAAVSTFGMHLGWEALKGWNPHFGIISDGAMSFFLVFLAFVKFGSNIAIARLKANDDDDANKRDDKDQDRALETRKVDIMSTIANGISKGGAPAALGALALALIGGGSVDTVLHDLLTPSAAGSTMAGVETLPSQTVLPFPERISRMGDLRSQYAGIWARGPRQWERFVAVRKHYMEGTPPSQIVHVASVSRTTVDRWVGAMKIVEGIPVSQMRDGVPLSDAVDEDEMEDA